MLYVYLLEQGLRGARAQETELILMNFAGWLCYLMFCDTLQLRSTYDVADDPLEQDITGVLGFLCLIKKMLRLRAGSLLWGGHPCCNHIWLSSSVHKRSFADPWGDWSQPSYLTACLYAIKVYNDSTTLKSASTLQYEAHKCAEGRVPI